MLVQHTRIKLIQFKEVGNGGYIADSVQRGCIEHEGMFLGTGQLDRPIRA